MISGGPERRLEPGGTGFGEAFDTSAPLFRPRRLLARLAPSHGAGPGSIPGGVTKCPYRLAGLGRCSFKAETRVQIPLRTPSPRQVESGQRYERRLRGSNPLGEAMPAAPARSRLSYGRSARGSTWGRYARVAQLEEHPPDTREVAGAEPAARTDRLAHWQVRPARTRLRGESGVGSPTLPLSSFGDVLEW